MFIDCPPSLGLLTLNALVAGEEMMIPIQAEYYALEGLGQLLATVDMVRQHLNPDLAISAILITMYDARTRLAAGVADEVREHFGDQVLKTYIPRSVRVSEAPTYSQTVMTYDPGSPGAMSYLEAARELAGRAHSPRKEPTDGGQQDAASGARPRPGLPDPEHQRARRGAGPESRRTTASVAEPSAPSAAAPSWPRSPGASFAELPVDRINPNASQPRQVFDEEAMAELVHSIREIGLLQPVVVRPRAPTRTASCATSW